MRKRILIILLCCLGLFTLAVGGAVWWTARYLRTPEFRTELARVIRETTGREVGFDGDINITLFPWFGIRADGVTLGNDPAFGETPLLKAQRISARIKVMPLLDKELSFGELELDKAAFVFTMNPKGECNWDSLVEHLRKAQDMTSFAGKYFHTISLRGIRLRNSSARLDDQENNHSYILTNLDLRTGELKSSHPLPFTLDSDFTWPRPGMVAHLTGGGLLHWNSKDPAPLLTDVRVDGRVGGTFMPKSAPWATLSTKVGFTRQGRDLTLSDVRLKIIGTEVSGSVVFVDVTDHFQLESKLRLGRFNPRSILDAYWPGTIAPAKQGTLTMAEGPLNLHADVRQLVFESPGLALDASRLKGSVRIGFDKHVSGLDFNLDADKLDADALNEAFTSNATASPLTVGCLPLRYLRESKGKGRVAAQTLTLAGVTGRGGEILWQAQDGVHKLHLKPFKAQGGTITADLAASFSGGTARVPAVIGWSGQLKMDDVDSRQVGWLNKGGVAASGPLDLRLRAQAKPAPASAATRLLELAKRGSGDFTANITPAQLAITPDGAGPRTPPQRMAFSSLSAQARFAPVPARDADLALQVDGGIAAVGTKPALNLEAKISGLARERQGKTTLTGATVSGRLKGWFLPRRENEAEFSGRGSMDFAGQTLSLSAATLKTCGLTLTGPLTGTKVLGRNAVLTGRLRCQEGDPKRVLAALEIKTPKASDKRALSRFSGEADITVSARGLWLSNIAAQLDDMPLRGTYAVQDFDAPRQTLSLSGGNFDLDRYLPAPPPTRHGVKPERPAPEPLPVDALRGLNLDGNVALRSLKYKGLTTRDFKTGIAAHGGSLLMKPLGGSFYGGSISGEFSAQVTPGGMQTRLAVVAKGFQAGGFMLGWAGKEILTGRADLFLDLTGAGATDQDIMRTLDGLGSFKVVDGSYYTTSSHGGGAPEPEPPQVAGHRQSSISEPVKKQPGPQRKGSRFSLASAKVRARQGVFSSEDFRMVGQGMVVTGKGQFCPFDDTINVNLVANMPGMPDVPMRVFGRLRDPEMQISTGALLGNTIKEILGIPLRPIKFFKDLLF